MPSECNSDRIPPPKPPAYVQPRRCEHWTPPFDPANFVARSMLAETAARLKRDGPCQIVAVVVSPPEWTAMLPAAWSAMVEDGKLPGFNLDEYAECGPDEDGWVFFARGTAGSRGATDGEVVARAIWERRILVGFTHDAGLLPPELLATADLTIELPGPDRDDVSLAACQMTGDFPVVHLTEQEAAALTPRMLRLAVRDGQSADDWLDRLRKLVAGMHGHPASLRRKNPRAAPDDAPMGGLEQGALDSGRIAATVEPTMQEDAP